MNLLKKAWDKSIRRIGRVLLESATAAKLCPMLQSTLGGWHPDSHRATFIRISSPKSRDSVTHREHHRDAHFLTWGIHPLRKYLFTRTRRHLPRLA